MLAQREAREGTEIIWPSWRVVDLSRALIATFLA
jgi:hypothetical protein